MTEIVKWIIIIVMNFINRLKKLFLASGTTLLIAFGSVVFAQSLADGEVKESIDTAFVSRSSGMLNTVLMLNREESNYPAIEKYVLDKTRQLIAEKNFEFAKETALVVVDNNISNFDAADLYSTIEKAIANDAAYRRN